MRMLLATDDTKITRWLQPALQRRSFAIDTVARGTDAGHLLATENYDIVLLDALLSESSGIDVLRRARLNGLRTPIIVLSADSELAPRVHALENGADDVMSRPLAFAELDARIWALLRRVSNNGLQRIACGPLHYDTVKRLFTVGHKPLELSGREHAVLEVLIGNAGRTVRKSTIHEKIYNLEAFANADAIDRKSVV